jgi:rubrerythrin
MKTIFLFLLVILFFSCGNESSSKSVFDTTKQQAELQSSEENIESNDKGLQSYEQSNIVERKLIKEGTIIFKTENIDTTRSFIIKATNKYNGYVVSENSFDNEDRKEYNITVKIPAENFDKFLENLTIVAKNLESKNILTQDVTEEYLDVEARIKSKKEILERFKEVLKQAKNVSEILEIQKEIGNIQTEIETYEGRLKYLQNKVSYSTLTIIFYEDKAREFGFWYKIKKALQSGWKGFLWIIIAFVYLWPLWLLLGVIIFVIIYSIKRRRKKLKSLQSN